MNAKEFNSKYPVGSTVLYHLPLKFGDLPDPIETTIVEAAIDLPEDQTAVRIEDINGEPAWVGVQFISVKEG